MKNRESRAFRVIVMLLALAMSSCVGSPPRGETVGPEKSSPPVPAPPPRGGPNGNGRPADDTAESLPPLWPTVRRGPRLRDGAQQRAAAFGREILGWKGAKFESLEPLHGPAGILASLSHVSGGAVTLTMVPLRGNPPDYRGWTVASVSAWDGGGPGMSVRVNGRRLTADFDGWPDDVSRAELIVNYRGHQVTAMVAVPPAQFDLALPFDPDVPGIVLMTFRDADGYIVTAEGTGIPAGDVVIDETPSDPS